MTIYVDRSIAYHEGGHAAMLWHYGIPLEYVSIKPDPVHFRAGVTVTPPRPDISGREPLENEMRASAAGNAATWHILGRPVPSPQYLTRDFDLAVADLQANPDSPIHNDVRDFADMGRARDEEFRNAGLDETGSASWVPVWLDAEEMIRGSLWPAVQAVADALLTAPSLRLDGEQAAKLMYAALVSPMA
jgi:hypothetical protein